MSEVIRLLDSEGQTVIDSISTEYEDSFCLETFGDLAEAHHNAPPKGKKSFILARVQTWDAKQPEKEFFSYYNAYHLNKILFQTQVYLNKKLIHRLHVLNPLTNTDIIGNVQYFMVHPSKNTSKFIAKRKDLNGTPTVEIMKTATIEEGNEEGLKKNNNASKSPSKTGSAKQVAPEPGSSQASSPTITDTKQATEKNLRIDTNGSRGSVGPKSAHVIEVEMGVAEPWTLVAPGVVAIPEEEEEGEEAKLGTRNIPNKPPSHLRKLSLQFKAKRSSRASRFDQDLNNPVHVVDMDIHYTPLSAPPRIIEEPSVGASPFNCKQPDVGEMDRRHSTTVQISTKYSRHPLSVMREMNKLKKSSPSGAVTQFSVPVPTDQITNLAPPTSKNRRRSLSYANAVKTTGTKATFHEWIQMVKDEQTNLDNISDYDSVSPFGSITKSDLSPTKKEDEDLEDTAVWDAILFATDSDFLESSKTRLIFRENAIYPEDSALFKMAEFTGEESSRADRRGDEHVAILLEDNTLCDFW